MGSQGAMRGTVILTNFEFSSTIIGKVSHLSGGFSGAEEQQNSCISDGIDLGHFVDQVEEG